MSYYPIVILHFSVKKTKFALGLEIISIINCGEHSAETFEPLWAKLKKLNCYFYVTDGSKVYPQFIPDGDKIIRKIYMTRVEGENTRLRHYLGRLH